MCTLGQNLKSVSNIELFYQSGHVQINHVNSRDVRLRAHRGHESGNQGGHYRMVRPGSAVYDPQNPNAAVPGTPNAPNHDQVGR